MAHVLNLNEKTKVIFKVDRATLELADLAGIRAGTAFIMMRVEADQINNVPNPRNMVFYGDDPTGDDLIDFSILFQRVFTWLRGSGQQDQDLRPPILCEGRRV